MGLPDDLGNYARLDGPHWGTTTKSIAAGVLIILFGLFFYLFRVVLVPLIVGMIMAFIFYPIARRVSTWTRLSHGAATSLVYLVLVALVIPLVIFLGPVVINQILLVQAELLELLQYLNTFRFDTIEILDYSVNVGDLVNQAVANLARVITSVASSSIIFVMGAARLGFLAAFTLVIGFYLTRDADRFVAWFINLAPLDYRGDTRCLLQHINRVWAAFFRGQLLLCATVAVLLSIASALLGLPQPLLLGLWGGLLEFLPSIGNTIWGGTALLVAAFYGSTYLPLPPLAFVLLVFGVFFAFIQLDTNVLIPNIIGASIQLHPMVVILGIIIGLEVGGFLGVALAAPTIASVRVLGRYVYAMLFDLEPFPAEARVTAEKPPEDCDADAPED